MQEINLIEWLKAIKMHVLQYAVYKENPVTIQEWLRGRNFNPANFEAWRRGKATPRINTYNEINKFIKEEKDEMARNGK